MQYLPKEKRTLDTQWRDNLELILTKGTRTRSPMVDEKGEEVDCITYLCPPPMRYKLENGFPINTARKCGFWKASIGELLGFINGANTQAELEEFGCKWWKYWVTKEKCEKRGIKEGDLGKGGYGHVFTAFETADGPFNQVEAIIQQMKERPELKTHVITNWEPQYTIRINGKPNSVVVCPCHGMMYFTILENKLNLTMVQRSGDWIPGVTTNTIQYSALLMAVARELGLEPDELVHVVNNAHVYVNQLPWAQELLERKIHPYPEMYLRAEGKTLWEIRPDDFELVDYESEPAMSKIPVTI